MSFPHKLFGKPVEHCHVDSRNRKVLGQHLAYATFEKPLCPEHDARHFGPSMDGAMVTLRDRGEQGFLLGAGRRRVHAPGRQLLGRAARSVDEDGVLPSSS